MAVKIQRTRLQPSWDGFGAAPVAARSPTIAEPLLDAAPAKGLTLAPLCTPLPCFRLVALREATVALASGPPGRAQLERLADAYRALGLAPSIDVHGSVSVVMGEGPPLPQVLLATFPFGRGLRGPIKGGALDPLAIALTFARIAAHDGQAGHGAPRAARLLHFAASPPRCDTMLLVGGGELSVRSDEASKVLRAVLRDFGRERRSPPDARLIVEVLCRLMGLPETVGAGEEAPPVCRIVYESEPVPRRRLELERLHGAAVLADPGGARAPSVPRRLRGTVIHNDPRSDTAVALGEHNPALGRAREVARLSDKWEEAKLVQDVAPGLSVPTFRLEQMLKGASLPRSDEAKLQRIAEILGRRLGRWILKPRWGFGSEGQLPCSRDDLVVRWRGYQEHFLPGWVELAKEHSDPDELHAAAHEELDFADGRTLELVLRKPSQVIVQRMLEHSDEVRVHVVEGSVLEGATTRRWWRPGPELSLGAIQGAEGALTPLLRSIPGISACPDLLVTEDGFKLIDLNPGLESGMYFPENDLWITHLLAERYSGRATPFLTKMRALEQAGACERRRLARELVREWGAFVNETETFGVYDRIRAAYRREQAAPSTRGASA